MPHSPLVCELAALNSMTDTERLEYFMTRVFEAEEVWYLTCAHRFFTREITGEHYFPLWPYKIFATEAALDYWHDGAPAACSLEYFMEEIIEQLHQKNILLDVMPRGEEPGSLISPKRLQAILQGMIDAGEYRLDS